MTVDRVLERLTAAARYHRERYDLYRAKASGGRATPPARLRELHGACQAAESRLAAAKAARQADATVGEGVDSPPGARAIPGPEDG